MREEEGEGERGGERKRGRKKEGKRGRGGGEAREEKGKVHTRSWTKAAA